MVEEMDALDKNESQDLIELPTRRKIVGRKLMFKNKLNVEGKMEKYKAFLVATGYSEVEGTDFGDFFLILVNNFYNISFLYHCFF